MIISKYARQLQILAHKYGIPFYGLSTRVSRGFTTSKPCRKLVCFPHDWCIILVTLNHNRAPEFLQSHDTIRYDRRD